MHSGNEFLTSNAEIAYPFKEDATGLARGVPCVHGASATVPLDMFVDGCIRAHKNITDVYLKSVDAAGGTNYTFAFAYQTGATILSGTVDSSTLTGTYSVLEFSVTIGLTRVIVKMVAVTSVLKAYLAGVTSDQFQYRLPFEATVHMPFEANIYTFTLVGNGPDVGPIDGDVVFMSGYNIDQIITRLDDNSTEILLSATPGGGEGLAPCQTVTPTIYKGLMATKADKNGNLNLVTGDDCYNIIPIKDTGILMIEGQCTSCCTCDDYVNVAKAIKRIYDDNKPLTIEMLNDARDEYNNGVLYFNGTIEPIYGRVVLVVGGSTGVEYHTLGYDPIRETPAGAPNWVTITATILNNSPLPFAATDLTLTIATPAINTIRSVNIQWKGVNYQPSSSSPVAIPYTLLKGERLVVNMRVVTPFVGTSPTSWTGNLIVTGNMIPLVGPVIPLILPPPSELPNINIS